MSDTLSRYETITEGDTARDTIIRLSVAGRALPVTAVSAVLRVDGTTVFTKSLTNLSATDWSFRWTDADFVSMPARDQPYTAQVKVTFDDGSFAWFPTNSTLIFNVVEGI